MDFEDTLKRYRKAVDNGLDLFFDNKIKEIKNPELRLNYSFMKEFVLTGGKRLRPIALIMAYKAVNGKDEKPVYIPSLSVELLHNSTLVHDDIMDEDELRRNKATVYKKSKDWFLQNYKEVEAKCSLFNNISSRFGVSSAILCGDVLLSMGYSALLVSENKNLKKALSVYNRAYTTVVDGQIMDILGGFDKKITEEEYFDIISKKTGALFKASVEIGAVLGDASEEQIKNLSNYALEAAMAFQIKDDIMDLSSGKGHEFGSDVKKGKKTLIIIKALESADSSERNKILDVLGKEEASSDEINSVIDILKSTGSIGYADEVAREKIKSAKKYLIEAGIDKEYQDFFEKLADYFVERKI